MEELLASDAQVQLWSAAKLAGTPCTYHIPVRLTLTGSFELQALRAGVSQVMRAHEVLRTSFELRGKTLWQKIHEELAAPLEVMTDGTLQESYFAELAARPMDLSKGPLFRVFLVGRQDSAISLVKDPTLVWVVHHLIADGASMSILLDDFHAALKGTLAVDPDDLAYADYSEWQAEQKQSEAGQFALEALRAHFANAPTQVLGPPKFPQKRGQGALRMRRMLGPEQVQGIQDHGRGGVTPLMLFSAALFGYLGRMGAGHDLCVGSTLAARNRQELCNVVGPLANTVLFRVRMAPTWRRSELLEHTKTEILRAQDAASLPLAWLLKARQGARNQDGHALFDVMLLVQEPMPTLPEGMSAASVDIDQKSAKFPLTLTFLPQAGAGWSLLAEACPSRFDAQALASFLEGLLQELSAMLDRPGESLSFQAPTEQGDAPATQTTPDKGRVAAHWPELASALGKLLGGIAPEPTQDFFGLGGDSIVAMQLVSVLREQGLELKTDDIFSQPQLGSLAGKVALLKPDAVTPELAPFEGPPSPLAAGMIYHTLLGQRQGQDDLYVQQLFVEVPGEIEAQAWQRAFDTLIERHESLRSVFRVDASQGLWQHFAAPGTVSMPVQMHAGQGAFSKDDLAGFRKQVAQSMQVPWMRLDLVSHEHGSAIAWSYHHALLDGWSAGLILGELLALVQGTKLPEPSELGSYSSYLSWVHAQTPDLGWWRTQLAGARTQMAPPIRAGAPETVQSSSLRVQVPEAVAQEIRLACRREKVTLAACLLAALSVVRGRDNAAQRFVWGSTVSGRDLELPGADAMVGLLMNTLPLVIDVQPQRGLRAWLSMIFTDLQALSKRSHTPLSKIKGAGGAPFDELWVYENYPVAQHAKAGELSSVGFHDAAHYPLCAVASDHQGMSLRLSYDARRYPSSQIQAWLDGFVALLQRWSSCSDWERPLGEMWVKPLETPHNVQMPKVGLANDEIRRLLQMAAQQPEACALESAGRRWSYGGLFCAAQGLARAKGIRAHQRVLICLSPGAGYVIAALACRMVGAVYIPVDPKLPPRRREALMAKARAEQVWSAEDPTFARDFAAWEFEGRAFEPQQFDFERCDQAWAYGIFTSGSSGEPKLVGVTQKGLAQLCAWHRASYPAHPGQRVAVMAGVGFDASVWELWSTLSAGGTLCIVPDDVRADPEKLRAYVEDEGIQDAFVPTAMVHRWAQGAWPRSAALLRLRTGGEALETLSTLPDYPLYNHYGPTEATVVSSVHRVCPAACEAPSSIGRAVLGGRLDRLDQAGVELGARGVGELTIGGPMADCVYLDDPRATARAFVPCPHGEGARRYRSGDLADQDEKGRLFYAGRMDRQVQISGVRIEPSEVEACLVKSPKLAQVRVVVDDKGLPARLLAVLVPHETWSDQDQERLEARLRLELPVSMRPCAYQVLTALPLTPSGKVDRERLLRLDWQDRASAQAPRTELAKTLLSIWKTLLPNVPDDENANFFALGGDSIVAVQMLARACAQGFELQAGDVEQAPTIAGLLQLHQAREASKRARAPVQHAQPGDDEALRKRLRTELSWGELLDEVYPAPPLAAGMLFVAKAQESSSEHYLESIELELASRLDEPALRQAFAHLVQETQTLASAFLFDPQAGPLVLLADATRLNARAKAAIEVLGPGPGEMQGAMTRARQSLRDWSEPLLMRAVVKPVGDAAFELRVLFAHVILDGWSTGRLLARWLELYRGYQSGHVQPRVQGDLRSYWAWSKSQDKAELSSYWQKRLRNIERPSLLGKVCMSQRESASPSPVEQTLPTSLASSLQEVAKAQAISVSTLCSGAFALTLTSYLRSSDLCFASTVSLRPPQLAQVESMIGLLINTVVTRIEIDPAQRLRDFLSNLHRVNAQDQAHAALPLSSALALAGHPSAQGDGEGLLDSLFVYENYPRWDASAVPTRQVGGVTLRRSEHRTHYALSLTVLAHQGYALRWGFDQDRLSGSWVQAFGERFVEVLTSLCAQASAEASQARLACVLFAGAQDARVPSSEPTPRALPDGFWSQVRSRSQAIALVDASGVYSYQALGERIARMAVQLRRAGLRPGQVAVIAVDPSIHSVTALWAIWACGAAFWTIDPHTPEQRLSLMLDKVRPEIWIGHSGEIPAQVPGRGICVLDPHEMLELKESLLLAFEPVSLDPGMLAYLIFTSGSTGEPKAVMVGHDSLWRQQAWVRAHRALGPDDVVLHKTPLSFDGALWEVLAPLYLGARCAIAPKESRLDPRQLWSFIVDNCVSAMQFVPAWIKTLVLSARQDGRFWPDSLRVIALGGERVEPALVREIWERSSQGSAKPWVHNVYGPTECTVDVTAYELCPEKALPESIPIGQSVANARNVVLDHLDRPCPAQTVGELCIGGTPLAWGYAQDPRATALAFVPDPQGAQPGARRYRSGDLVYRDQANNLVFVGRCDDQVKVGGHRIDLLEVEAALCGLASSFGVAQIAALVHQGEHRASLWAAYTACADAPADITGLTDALQAVLPASHRPRHYVEVQAWPTIRAGKTDRKALARSVQSGPAPALSRVASSEGLSRMCGAWSLVFPGQVIDEASDFFALGGDSISCMQLIGHLRQQGFVCAPKDVFEHPKLSDLLCHLETQGPAQAAEGSFVPASQAIALSPIQAAFDARALAFPEHYNQSVLVSLHHRVDPAALAGWLAKLVERHPVLRAGGDEDGWPVEVHRCGPKAALEEVFVRAHERLSRSRGPLARAVYVEQSGADVPAKLLLVIHHWVVDAVSWRILLSELAALAANKSLPDGPEQGMRDWKQALGSYLQSAQAQAECVRWQELGVHRKGLVLDETGGPWLVANASEHQLWLDASTTQAILQRAATKPRVGLTSLLLACLAQSLWRNFVKMQSADALWIAVEGHGRESDALVQELGGHPQVELGQSVGWFTSVYPFVGDLAMLADLAPRNAALAVQTQLSAASLRGAAFGAIKYFGTPDQRAVLQALPEPQVSWNYLGQMDPSGQDPWVQKVEKDPAKAQAPGNARAYPLDASAYLQGGRLCLVWSYCRHRLEVPLVEAAFEHWAQSLKAFATQVPQEPQVTNNALPDLEELAMLLDLDHAPQGNDPTTKEPRS